MGDFEAASRHIEMLKPIVQVSNDVRLKAFYQSEVAQMYAQQQNYVGAVEAAEQSFAGFSFTGETLSLFQAGIVAAISLTSTDRHNEARAYLERVSVLAAENPVEVIDANDRETLRLVQLWAWAAEVQVTSGWENHFVTHPLETDYSISETLKRFEELNEVTFDMLEIAPFQVAELLVLKTETLFENCEQSSISSIQSQACISHILEIFEKCDSDISPLQRARLHHLLAKVRSHRYEAFRSFAQALAIYVEIEDRDKIMELVAEIKQLASYRTEEEIEKAWNQPKSQKAKAVKTSLEG
jgi:hypothetical protein